MKRGQFLERSESSYFPQLKDKEVNVSMAAPLTERDGVLKKKDFISVRQLAVQKILANRWRRNCITGQRYEFCLVIKNNINIDFFKV